MTEKYELREGEKFIEEYIDNDGNHVTIFEDINGTIRHGWVLKLDQEIADLIERAAEREGVSVDDFVDIAIEQGLQKLMEEDRKRKAIEEISD